MYSDNQEAIYCDDDGEYRIQCHICDKVFMERFYKNPLKSQTHTKNIRKKENSKNQFK